MPLLTCRPLIGVKVNWYVDKQMTNMMTLNSSIADKGHGEAIRRASTGLLFTRE
jgi:hypothetical protein